MPAKSFLDADSSCCWFFAVCLFSHGCLAAASIMVAAADSSHCRENFQASRTSFFKKIMSAGYTVESFGLFRQKRETFVKNTRRRLQQHPCSGVESIVSKT
ncbi:MAG: hypothetical protein MUF62_03490 [Chitinophagaceae bacterium]|nr:hypothetical protein [Chitinophagaceae bacterium]